MTVKQMKEILNKLPDNAQIVELETAWEDDCLLEFAMSVSGLVYYPKENEVFLCMSDSQEIREIHEDYDYDTDGITYLAEN